jgi:hypothetical protein
MIMPPSYMPQPAAPPVFRPSGPSMTVFRGTQVSEQPIGAPIGSTVGF